MAVRKVEEIMESLKTYTKDRTDDDTLAFVEDMTDTINSLNDTTDWKSKMDESDRAWQKKLNDKDTEWRNKYKERFFSAEQPDTDQSETDQSGSNRREEPKKKTKFEDLFTYV